MDREEAGTTELELLEAEEEAIQELVRRGDGRWVRTFLALEYFGMCEAHKLWKNRFCIECEAGPMCQPGQQRAGHAGHPTLQARKASTYASVAKSDIDAWLDVSAIQIYSINGHDIVFLRRRPMAATSLPPKEPDKVCLACERALRDSPPTAMFCCIECKIVAMRRAILLSRHDSSTAATSSAAINASSPRATMQWLGGPELNLPPLTFTHGIRDGCNHCCRKDNMQKHVSANATLPEAAPSALTHDPRLATRTAKKRKASTDHANVTAEPCDASQYSRRKRPPRKSLHPCRAPFF